MLSVTCSAALRNKQFHIMQGVMHPDIRAACIQVLFSAVYHLKSAVLPYSSDLLNLSLKFLSRGSEKVLNIVPDDFIQCSILVLYFEIIIH
jgi:hypothetical protein